MLEFIYTSAPETLDGPGYGAVAKTERFPGDLEKFIRKQCWYDFLSQDGDTSIGKYPKVVSHSIYKTSTEEWHVFSKTEYAGLDYTQRSVFLAHHVVCTSKELREIRVTDLLRQPELFRSSWNEPPKLLAAREVPTQTPRNAGMKSWGQVTGDQKWSHVWARKWLSSKNESRFLILPRNVDALPLYLESLDTMTADQAAGTTFITLIAKDHHGPAFEWIGLQAKSELADLVSQKSAERVLNLSNPLGSAAVSLEQLDRVVKPSVAKKAIPAPPVHYNAEADPTSDQFIPDEYRVQQPQTKPKSNPRRHVDDSLPDLPAIPASRPSEMNTIVKYLSATAILGAFCVLFIVFSKSNNTKSTIDDSATGINATPVEGTQTAQPEKPETKTPEKLTEVPVKRDPVSSNTPLTLTDFSERPNKQEQRKTPVAELKFVERGLQETFLASKDKDQPGKLIESMDELTQYGLKFRLVSGFDLQMSELRLPTKNPISPELTVLSLSLNDRPKAEIQLQVGDGSVILKVPGETNEKDKSELFDCLRISNLEIESTGQDPFLIRICFCPKLPGILTTGLTRTPSKADKVLSDESNNFFEALNHCQSSNLIRSFLRINRISLSIPSGHDFTGLLPNVINSEINKDIDEELQSPDKQGAIVVRLKLNTHIDRKNHPSMPAFAAELTFSERTELGQQGATGDSKPNEADPSVPPNGNEKKQVPSDGTKAEGSERKNLDDSVPKDPQKNESFKMSKNNNKNNKNLQNFAKEPETSPELRSIDNLLKVPEILFLNGLFRRYGRIDADIVVRVPGVSTSDKDDHGNDVGRRKKFEPHLNHLKSQRDSDNKQEDGVKKANERDQSEIVIFRFGE